MKNRRLLILYIMLIWFVISFVTNLIGPLMPIIINDFHLSLGLAGFLPFSFFLAYGLISIPGGILVERKGARTTLLIAFGLNLLGSLAIALKPEYGFVIGGLFVIGLGMALLQVVINPLLRTTGGESQFAFFSVMGQLVFGLASFVSPVIFQWLMERPGAAGSALVWVVFYWAFSGLFFALIAINYSLPLPRLELTDAEKAGGWGAYRELLSRKDVRLFFIGIVAYVGTEQTLANWMSQFLITYHHFSATGAAADAVGQFWGLMSLGCLVGLVMLKLLDSKIVLAIFSVMALACVGLALYGTAGVAILAFPAAGFCLSVMFSVIFSLALNSVPRHQGAFSGILCTGILGGAVVPLLVGQLGDHIGLRAAMNVVFVTLGFIFAISFWARPLISNETSGWFKFGKRLAPGQQGADFSH
ncbi:MFS transporter [Janthinobacterium agaricidamnosum]|uniref:Major Facilitator Superfamily protein n=1 Tax=Janthinobacterium agaricidamnosum NBRC 102515 = DSM 9628 TaxID=1349767 RepID=W0V3K9_9BURK|nr:MFS transporter [Janthinobacterium agaricidamnosum]CDG82436.1 major Facilitator Superfamily protein [Janthinobacterium agaricidamnosum NBRC 102515 = DSM 9628]